MGKKRLIQEGRLYSVAELADLARRGLQSFDGGVTRAQAAAILNKRYAASYTKGDIQAAIIYPGRHPQLVLRLVDTFTAYRIVGEPHFEIRRKN
ncbi:MAG: hypothetical protein ACE5G0_03105 [Rhodothermales bacterium]